MAHRFTKRRTSLANFSSKNGANFSAVWVRMMVKLNSEIFAKSSAPANCRLAKKVWWNRPLAEERERDRWGKRRNSKVLLRANKIWSTEKKTIKNKFKLSLSRFRFANWSSQFYDATKLVIPQFLNDVTSNCLFVDYFGLVFHTTLIPVLLKNTEIAQNVFCATQYSKFKG